MPETVPAVPAGPPAGRVPAAHDPAGQGHPWAALEVYAVIVLIGGAFAVPVVLPLLGAVLVLCSSRWGVAARLGTVAAVAAPVALVTVSVPVAVAVQTLTSSVCGVLLALALRRRG